MKFVIDNKSTKLVIGGTDNLIPELREKISTLLSVKNEDSFHVNRHMRKAGKKFQVKPYHELLTKKNTFATGFLPMVIELCEELGVTMTFEDIRKNVPKLILKHRRDYSTPKFRLYDHQRWLVDSLENWLEIPIADTKIFFPRGMWKAATNSGKTAAAAVLIKNVENPKALLLVNNQTLFEQHTAFFKTMFPVVGQIGSVCVGITRNGKPKYKYLYDTSGDVVIAMVESLHSKMTKSETVKAEVWNLFNMLIVDESHDYSGNTATTVIQGINAGLTLFMSGTPLSIDNKFSKAKLIGMSGRVLKIITKEYLMENGFSMRANVKVYLNPEEEVEGDYKKQYLETILRSEKRAELVADLMARRTKKKILVAFWERQHGFLMYATFIEKYPHLAPLTNWVHGEDPDRPQKIQDYIDGKIQYLFTSTIMQQGINVKDIQIVINTMGGKNDVPVDQFMGRGERLDGIDRDFEYIDIFDRGFYLKKHSLARIKYYRKEKLKLTLKYQSTPLGSPKY